jgi:hypothetical protein
MEYFELYTPDDARSTLVFQTPDFADFSYSLLMPESIPPAEGNVDRQRRNYYWAWGATWITGIAAWISYYSYLNSNAANNYVFSRTGEFNQGLNNSNNRLFYTSVGAVAAVGVAAIFDIFFMSRYIYTANKGSTSVSGTGRN